MKMSHLLLGVSIVVALLPSATAIPEPARSTIDNATFQCYDATLAEAERREAQGAGLASGQVPYRLPRVDPNDPFFAADPRPTIEDAAGDALITVSMTDEAMLETSCVLLSVPNPFTPPDVVGLVWDLISPVVCAQLDEC